MFMERLILQLFGYKICKEILVFCKCWKCILENKKIIYALVLSR